MLPSLTQIVTVLAGILIVAAQIAILLDQYSSHHQQRCNPPPQSR